jgi:uncharacterized membrane protein YhaH (DUF805 family)
MFSLRGELNRIDYLIYGLIVPIAIFIAGMFLVKSVSPDKSGAYVVMALGLISVYIMLNATVKRANNTASSTLVVMILWFVLTPIAVLYLLFAPEKVTDNSGEAKKQMSLIGVIAVIFLAVIALGIVSAVVSKSDKSQNIEQEAPKISKTTPNQ